MSRFYGATKKDATVQGYQHDIDRYRRVEVDERILRIAEAEYERTFGTHEQTIDVLRERGGLSITEMIALLADAVVRYAPTDALIAKSLTRAADPGEEGR